ncbi:hypothetical protein [Streptosporangium jomthongense]|uniref:Uncharacterized protein n=1 Tax=Streptosporangium jomthongense TaxID=1193683 RepID=A0ABV8FFS6_9ACTN
MLLAEHYDAVEADLWMHCHRTDLRDLWRPGGGDTKLTWRLLRNLIRHLPSESATKTALRNRMTDAQLEQAGKEADPSQAPWSQEEMLLASLIDSVRTLIYVVIRVNGGKGRPPQPMTRPGVKKARRRQFTAEQREAIWRRINGGRIEGAVIDVTVERVTVQSKPGAAST